MDSQQKSAKMFITFEELWSSGRSLLPVTGPSAASSLLWVTPLIAAPASCPACGSSWGVNRFSGSFLSPLGGFFAPVAQVD